MEGVSVPGFEFTRFGASGVQIAKPLPARRDQLLRWAGLAETRSFCLIQEALLNAKQERYGRLHPSACVAPSQPRNAGTNARTYQKQPVSRWRGWVQGGVLVSRGSRSISACFNPTSTHQQWMAPGLLMGKTPDSAHWQGREWAVKLASAAKAFAGLQDGGGRRTAVLPSCCGDKL